ncbi:AAA-ATPase ASD, mitochondrial-like [Salvia splendens]|uniref:AAA-ATPase ASD, mitochondrial-like n=1 Tax=Salvia splendens TaxID=180675 RepID=UPI0011036EAB|nr:AAA-ATPase ASD, mitochondrial-like [Salvia splendens]
MRLGAIFGQLGTLIAGLMFLKAILDQYLPRQLKASVDKHSQKLLNLLSPYIQITFNEFTGERFKRSDVYASIETYLSSTSAAQARRLKADSLRDSTRPVSLSMDDNEEVADEHAGVKVWWSSGMHITKNQTFSFQPMNDEKRFYNLRFHKKHRNFIIDTYLNHVMKEGKAIEVRNRRRKLYTNSGAAWTHVAFEHPATFGTLAMEPARKREVVEDLLAFSKGEAFYNKIGRAWKRGYLLHGPPGTGKSTMIAAMANLLGYDVYDLELTAVKDNTELKKLLIATSSRAVIVIEDIDCSVDLTGQRVKRREKEKENENNQVLHRMGMEENEAKSSKITLSGLLNFIDGLWSACGGERIIVFTTNYVEKLDPALIRRGRMDKHIELSYCSFEGFKVLAKNYIGVEWHELFPRIERLLGEVEMTPADVAENLMPRSLAGDAEECLESLVRALEAEQKKSSANDDETASPGEKINGILCSGGEDRWNAI